MVRTAQAANVSRETLYEQKGNPMSSFAPNYTGRYRAHYHVCGIDHTIQLRKQLGATPTQVGLLAATVQAIFAAAASRLCTDFAWLGAEQADEGSDLFYPSTTPGAVTPTGVGPNSYTPFQKVTHTRFGARALGSRTSIEMYGLFWEYSNQIDDVDTVGYDGVITPAEAAFISTIAGLLNTQAFANSGGATVWQARATIKVNDFWLRQVRSGGIT